MNDIIILINHPIKRTIIQGRSGRYDSHGIDETKDCVTCTQLKHIESTKKTGYRLTEEHLQSIIGVCVWGKAWKIVWRRDKPKKCVKLSAAFAETINNCNLKGFQTIKTSDSTGRYIDEEK